MKIIPEPLKISAPNLLIGVELSHYGVLFVYAEKRTFGKPWDQCYVILSEGCLYIYKNKNSEKSKESYSLKHFEYVRESEPEKGENICFCLHYRNGKPPKLFACDTPETREEWIKKLRSEMSDVHSTFCLSADSGYGSAGTVPALRESDTYETEELDVDGRKYDKVDERLFGKAFQPDKKNTQAQRNVKHELHSEDIDYEPVNFSHELDVCKRVNDIEPANQGSSEGLGAIGNREEAPIKTKPKIYMEELKSRLKSDHRGLSSGIHDLHEKYEIYKTMTYISQKIVGKDTQAKTSLLKSASLASVASSYLSVKIGDETSDNVTPSTGQPVVQTQVGERGSFRRDSSFASSYLSIRGGDEISDNVKFHLPSQHSMSES